MSEKYARIPGSSSKLAAATTFHSWPLLPTELKLEVLSYCVPHDDNIAEHTHRLYFKVGSLMGRLNSSQNRDLVNLSLEVYYTSNRIVISIQGRFKQPQHPHCPPLAYRSKIRHLTVKFSGFVEDALGLSNVNNLYGSGGSLELSAWRYLFRRCSISHPTLDGYVAWQALFPEVRSLSLAFDCASASVPMFSGSPNMGAMGPIAASMGMGPLGAFTGPLGASMGPLGAFGPPLPHPLPHLLPPHPLPYPLPYPLPHPLPPFHTHLGAIHPESRKSGPHDCKWNAETLKAIEKWLGTVQPVLKADKVDVKFTNGEHLLLPWYTCRCARSVENVIAEMALRKKSSDLL